MEHAGRAKTNDAPSFKISVDLLGLFPEQLIASKSVVIMVKSMDPDLKSTSLELRS